MRIVLFWDYYGPYHFARLAGAIAAAGKKGHVVCGLELAGRSATYAWKREHHAEDMEFTTLFPDKVAEQVSSWRVFRGVKRYFQEHPADVLFVPSYWPAYVFAATLAARSCGLRVVIMAESHYATGRNSGMLVFAKRALVRLYGSAMVGGSAQRSFFRYLGMPPTHIFDGYDVVDNQYFASRADEARKADGAWRKTLRLPARYILSLGRFVPKKNLQTLLRAYASAVAQGKLAGVHLVFVGSGSQQADLQLLALQLRIPLFSETDHGEEHSTTEELPNAVHFHAFAQIETTPVYYGLAELFVLPSRSEEWGLVVNEAMASGCPVAVSNLVGCSSDLVTTGETGFRFNPDNPDELAWYLGEVCERRELRDALADAGRKRIAEWGPGRFGKNVIAAADATYQIKVYTQPEQDHTQRKVILLQTSFPDYRIPVYEGLSQSLGADFQLYTGMEYFTPDVRTCAEFRPWIIMVKNTFLSGRRFLWQEDVLADMLAAEIVIMELNPRILSNWVILFTRALWGRPTILWGHAWGREGDHSLRNILRLLMMRAASAIVTYTHSQKEQLKRVLPHIRIVAAPNSSVRRSEAIADLPAPDDLNTILYVGRLNPAKKPGLLLDSFIAARSKLPSTIKLCFVGTGEERAGLESRVRAAGLTEWVKFKGHVGDRQALRSIYARTFCAVSPGYVGLSAIQAFSFGVPMVIADNENHAPEIEACRESENTVFFPSDNVEQLAEALVRMWTDRVDWAAKRARIAGWVGANYSTDVMVDAFIESIHSFRE